MKSTTSTAFDSFFNSYPLKRYKKGHILILSGEQTQHAYSLVEGKMKIYDVTYRGDEIIINTFQPPAFFPLSLIINATPTRYIYEADSDIIIRQAPRLDTVRFLDSHPAVVLDLLAHLYSNVDNILERMVHSISSNAKGRLVYSLIDECRNFGEQQADGSFILRITERELGARAGLSRETVSREAKSLKITKLIEIHHTNIVIPNLKKLERYLEIHM